MESSFLDGDDVDGSTMPDDDDEVVVDEKLFFFSAVGFHSGHVFPSVLAGRSAGFWKSGQHPAEPGQRAVGVLEGQSVDPRPVLRQPEGGACVGQPCR